MMICFGKKPKTFLKGKIMTKHKKYLMMDGTELTVEDVCKATGLSKVGAYNRLRQSDDKNWVLTPKGCGDMKHGPKRYTEEWVDEPVEVVMGIPINPSYLDGMVDGDITYDRNGYVLRLRDATALEKYRAKLRKQWRKDNKKTIKNRRR